MEIKYEDIKKANDTIDTMEIKGKEYAQVNQRINAFRMVYPEGAIITRMISNDNGVCVFVAEAYEYYYTTENGSIQNKILGTGTAYEKENSTFINKTSYIENCESSAVGRALGMCGFGIDVAVASAEEVQNAINNQEKKETLTPKQLETLNKLSDKAKETVFKKYKVEKLEDLTTKQASEIIKLAMKNKEKNENGTN